MSKKIDQNKKAFSLIEISIVILIIGILIAGVASGSRLVAKSKLRSVQNLTIKSVVNEIDGLVGWWETALDNAIFTVEHKNLPKDGDKVSAWNDINPQIGFKEKLTQSVSADQPTYLKNGINNLPSIKFNATSTSDGFFLIGPRNSSFVTTTFSIFMVTTALGPNSSQGRELLINGDNFAPSSGYTLSFFGPDTWTFGLVANSGSGTGHGASGSAIIGQPSIIFARFDGTYKQFYVNGQQKFSLDMSSSGYLPPDVTDSNYIFRVGCTIVNFYCYYGNISEIIMYGRSIDDDEKKDVELYLAKKYGIKIY